MHSMTDEQILIVKAARSLHQLGAMAARFDAVARSQESCNLATAFEVKHELLAYCNRNGISAVEFKEREYKENLDDTA